MSDRVRVGNMGEKRGGSESPQGVRVGSDNINGNFSLTPEHLEFSETQFSGLYHGVNSHSWSHGR